MKALIVGGDDVRPIKQEMASFGVRDIQHWNGRKPGSARRSIPSGTGLIIVVWDCVNHGLSWKLRKQAKRSRVPVLYCRQSATDARRQLQELHECDGAACARIRSADVATDERVHQTGTSSWNSVSSAI